MKPNKVTGFDLDSAFTSAPSRQLGGLRVTPTQELIETVGTYIETQTLPPEREIALQTIAYIRSLKDNFDGNGTCVPDENVLDTAERFVNRCFGRMYPTSIYPGMDRTLILGYERRDIGGTLQITLEADSVFISKITTAGKLENLGAFSLPFAFISLPQELRNMLPSYIMGK